MAQAPRAEIKVDEGWIPFDFSDPRCPECGAEMEITNSDVEQQTAVMEYGYVAVYCTADEDHMDNNLQFRRVIEGIKVYESLAELGADSEITHYERSGDPGIEGAIVVEPFIITKDPDFQVDYRSVGYALSGYVIAYWGAGIDTIPFLINRHAEDIETFARYEWDQGRQLYVSDGTVYPTREAAERGREA